MIDTPINVIITAQDLPGMSGLEALKEAKKRSPDTIGILIANSGQEAIVGEEEVFQVVSGDVTSDGLKQLVDNATRQLRLMALAESANDTKADPDLTAEHIVMETSENGSTIISDGTGRLPILDPKKVSAAQSVGSRAVDILVLTKDQEFLETIKDSSRGMHDVHYANTLKQADEFIRKHKVGVAVVDAAMVGDKIEQLTQHLRKGSARLVSIVAGRRDDGEMMMDLINRGKVYRFLLKPVSPGRARLAVEASVKHHLEAPDSAFKIPGGAAAPTQAAAMPAAKPENKVAPISKAEAKPKAAAKPQPVAKPAKPKKVAEKKPAPKAAAKESATPVDPPLGSADAPQGGSPVEDGLADAFGADDSSFTETVTGLVSNLIGKAGKKKAAPEPAVENVAPELPSLDSIDSIDAMGATKSGDGSGGLMQPKFIGIAAAAVVIVAGALFWFMGGSDDEVPTTAEQQLDVSTPAVSETTIVVDEAPLVDAAADVDALLADARAARAAGQVFNPPGSNAIELFSAALAADPENNIVAAELDATIGDALALAETALIEGRVSDAQAALTRVAAASPGHARLPFLTAQLTQMQLRNQLDSARNAIRETRFEDAAALIVSARSLGVADASEIDTVAAELSAARSAQQVDDVLAKANARLEAGDLLSPANDNARYYYQLVLSNDPGNTAARQGLNGVASKLVLQARAEIDAGDLNAAEDLLADARAIDGSSADLAATASALINARESIAAAERAEAARLETERLAELERQAEAERQAQAERQAELDRQAEAERQAELQRAAAERPAAQPAASGAVADSAASDATVSEPTTAPAKSGDSGVVDGAAIAAAGTQQPAIDTTPDRQPETQAATPPPVTSQAPAPVSSLSRIKYVAPKYPRMAQRRNQSGWVDVVFTVATDGTVKDIDIRDSEPGTVFVDAARNAVERWEFEPVVENGAVIEKRAGVRMMFALE
ncbi:MAG: TonB family protein [Pseudomonadota bacterium]